MSIKYRFLNNFISLALILTVGFLLAGTGYKGSQWVKQRSKTNKINNSPDLINQAAIQKQGISDNSVVFGPGGLNSYFNRSKISSSRGAANPFSRLINLRSSSIEPMITSRYLEDRITYLHKGIDISVPVGTEVKSFFSGKFYKGNQGDRTGFGRYVYIVHDNGLVTYYGHLIVWANIEDGEQVEAGQVIGFSGNTGDSSGPHLHFEVRRGEQSLNPMNYLR